MDLGTNNDLIYYALASGSRGALVGLITCGAILE